MDHERAVGLEANAEAALALATCDASLTGRVTYSLPLLRELGREIRTLDGQAVVEPGRQACSWGSTPALTP